MAYTSEVPPLKSELEVWFALAMEFTLSKKYPAINDLERTEAQKAGIERFVGVSLAQKGP